jgi:hypothetical protein
MDILFFFTVISLAVMVLVLRFDKKQTIKVNAVLKESRNAPPLLLLKLTEEKINSLKTALRYDDIPQNMAAAGSMSNIYAAPTENRRQSKVQELKALSSKYNNGQISIESYNMKLDELLQQVQNSGDSFGLAS